MLQSFPLLALSLALFWFLNLTTGSAAVPWYMSEALSIRLLSHDTWHVSCGDLFLLISMVLLFVEVIRSTRSDGKSITNHALSVLVFVAALMLFLTQPGYGNSEFCIFMSMTLLDFMAGFIITSVAARRDISFNRITGH